MKKIIFSFMLLFSVLSFGAEKLLVFTSILPQKYLVEKIGGNKVDVQVMVEPGKSPGSYTPTPNQVIALSKSKIFFTIDVPFEKVLLDKVQANLKTTEIVNTTKGIIKRDMEVYKPNGNMIVEKTSAKDPHVWLSPKLAKIQVKNMYDALVKIDSKNKTTYLNGYNALINELDSLDKYAQNKLEKYKGRAILVFHPAFGYFTDDYGLVQVAIETGGKEPLPATLEAMISDAKKNKIKTIFVQPEFSQKSAKAIATAINGKVITLNSLSADYINNIKDIVNKIEGALKNEQ